MKKIKYQGGLTKLIARKIANGNKKSFANKIDKDFDSLLDSVKSDKKNDLDVVSFSSKYDFSEQILSILTYIRYLGAPNSWVLYSDGSHTEQQIQLLSKFPFLKVERYDWEKNSEQILNTLNESLIPYKEQFLHYALKLPLGKRLVYYLNHPIKQSTLFIDSDILFYKKAEAAFKTIDKEKAGWLLPDAVWGCLDSRYKKDCPPQMYQANGGFFIFNKPLSNVTKGLEFLRSAEFTYEYFTDQNVFHILFQENDFVPLDPRIFILDSSDQFDFSYAYNNKDIAMRHYTGPVRHKMWQKNWKWHLDID